MDNRPSAGHSADMLHWCTMNSVSGPDMLLVPVRWAYLAMGVGFVGLGSVGFFVPVMPSTVFFIVALWAFKRSSPKLERRLLQNPIVGQTLRHWDEHRAIKKRTKVVAISLIWACLAVSATFVRLGWVVAMLGCVGVLLTWFLATRRDADTLPPELA